MPTDAPAEHTMLRCMCGKEVSGMVTGEYSWERLAHLAERHGWYPVILGDAVGASQGSHFYACSRAHQEEWLNGLRTGG